MAQAIARDALSVQLRVVNAMILREMQTRFGASRLGVFWAVIEPVMHITVAVLISLLMYRGTPFGGHLEVLFATGLIPFFMYRDMVERLTHSITANRTLLHFPIVKNLDAFFARVICELLIFFAIGCLFLLFFWLAGYNMRIKDPLEMLSGFLAMAYLAAGFGSITSVVMVFWHGWERISGVLARVMYLASGGYFVVDKMPQMVQDILSWVPVSHAVVWVRQGFYEGYDSHFIDKGYVLGFATVTLAIGLTAERLLRSRMEMEL